MQIVIIGNVVNRVAGMESIYVTNFNPAAVHVLDRDMRELYWEDGAYAPAFELPHVALQTPSASREQFHAHPRVEPRWVPLHLLFERLNIATLRTGPLYKYIRIHSISSILDILCILNIPVTRSPPALSYRTGSGLGQGSRFPVEGIYRSKIDI